ncbi:MAG: hypothetical protein MJH10_15545 [Epibacterium sp.]|nr:hypothetical protein [Epibacterium sp.]
MRFKPSLWDDSDPDYAPGLRYRSNRDNYFWRATDKCKKAGFGMSTYELGGSKGDGLDLERAAHCRALTREMVDWYEGKTQGKEPGTWAWLIGRYFSDEFSSYHDIDPQTQIDYRKALKPIENAIGEVLISETDFVRIAKWKKLMQENGRSAHYIKKWFTHWRLIVSHGIKIGIEDCLKIKAIRTEMRIPSAPRREGYATREQIEAIVAEADRQERPIVALAILLRFEFMLRGVDVHGKWVPAAKIGGGIQHNGQAWVDGLTWDMFDSDVTQFSKVFSKTKKTLTEATTYDLALTPDIRARLLAIPREKRTGPVLVAPSGLPPKNGFFTRNFKRLVRDLKLPDELQIRDTRSGGALKHSIS